MTDHPDLDLIDIDAMDDEDGGLDAGLDFEKFPRASGHQDRAHRATARWQRQSEEAALAEHDQAKIASSTLAKYEANWQAFGGWCHARPGGPIEPLEADDHDIRSWVLALTNDGLKMPTIEGRLAAVRWHFEEAGLPSPTTTKAVAGTLEASRRKVGTATRRARPLLLDDLRRIVAGMPTVLNKPPDHIRVLRDRAILTLGWASALRVSNLVALDIDDLSFFGDPDTGAAGGVLLRIQRSKTDQHGEGSDIGVPYSNHFNSCPVRSVMALQRKLMNVTNRDPLTGRREPVQSNTGPLFRSVHRGGRIMGRLSRQGVDDLIAFYVDAILLDDPTQYSTHSLRRGFVIECGNRGVPEMKIRRVTGHTSSAGLATYDRPTEHFEHAPLAGDWW